MVQEPQKIRPLNRGLLLRQAIYARDGVSLSWAVWVPDTNVPLVQKLLHQGLRTYRYHSLCCNIIGGYQSSPKVYKFLQDLPEAPLDIGLAHRACMMDNQAVYYC
jgi:hypothetical protein